LSNTQKLNYKIYKFYIKTLKSYIMLG